jgi:flagellar export protein FliJ
MKVCQHQVNAEQLRLRQLLTEKDRILLAIKKLKEKIEENENRKSQKKEFSSREIQVIISYIDSLNFKIFQLTNELAEMETKISRQRDRLIEARRRLKPVEKLKEYRKQQHDYEVDRELQAVVDELHLLRLNRESSFDYQSQ